MATMKVILKQDISNLGEEGDIKIVKKGYARNFLLPKKMVVNCTKKNLVELESMKDYLENRKEEKRVKANELKEKIEKEKVNITVPAGEKGRLYGTVTNNNISEELNKLGYNIEKKSIELKEHIKLSGTYKYKIHLYQDIYADMELIVTAKIEKPKQQKAK